MAQDSYPTASVHPLPAHAAYADMPPPRARVHLHWSNWVAIAGGGAMALALVLVALGIPSSFGYDESEPGAQTKYEGWNPSKINASIDANMKYLVEATGYEKGAYNYSIRAVDESETPLPAMGARVNEMNTAVEGIDSSLGDVLTATERMNADMLVMAATSGKSAATMRVVAADLKTLSTTMRSLYGESKALDTAMARIEKKAAAIAKTRTAPAAAETRKLNGVLPHDVPSPVTSLEPGDAQ